MLELKSSGFECDHRDWLEGDTYSRRSICGSSTFIWLRRVFIRPTSSFLCGFCELYGVKRLEFELYFGYTSFAWGGLQACEGLAM